MLIRRLARYDSNNTNYRTMSERLPLLIELGCEELPVRALPGLATAFRNGIATGLERRGIAFTAFDPNVLPLYSPRRLAVRIEDVAVRQPDQASEVLGPYLNIALDADGQPTRALQGFAQKAGVDWTALERTTDAKGERFVYRSVNAGAATADLLPEILAESVAALPIPKPMRWGDHDYAFARPVHWLVLLFGDQVVDCKLLGVRSGRDSRGHRFHHPQAVTIESPARYAEQLETARVLVDPQRRRQRIVEQATQAAAAQGQVRLDADILDEVNCLVEWPVAIACSFERDFLRVPQEALILTMETNQKFFPVLDGAGRLTEHFIGIANIESDDPAQVRLGYERVIRPRFADARFFYDEDLKTPLAAHQEALKQVTYQQKLGSIWDKCQRVAALAETIAAGVGVDPAQARRAAELAKCDLLTRMVGEFPELQGTMGRYYAAADESSRDIADALDEFYQPRQSGDEIAPSALGQVLAIAERLDTLAGGFEAGLAPTGNKDPFALRRAALGLARSLIECNFDIVLPALLDQAVELASRAGAGTSLLVKRPPGEICSTATGVTIYSFILERLRGYYEQRGNYDPNIFEAVAAVQPQSLKDFDQRLLALRDFAGSDDGAALAAANKRCGNLLRKAAEAGEPIPDEIDANRFELDAERTLASELKAARTEAGPLFEQRQYGAALTRLARLRPAVDAYFDAVMVMADDPAVRGNRLATLRALQAQFLRIADIGRLAN